jgi:hypothetical protein
LQFVVVGPHLRADMGDQAAGVDAGVDPVQSAAHLLRLAVVQGPEGAVGPAVFGRQAAVQVGDAQPPLLSSSPRISEVPNTRSASGFSSRRQLHDVGVVDVRHLAHQFGSVQLRAELLAEEELASRLPV